MKISIITITYNSEKTIRETFESVLCQNYRPLEYIIVDGKSTDRTIDLIEEHEERFKSSGIIFSWLSEKDKGISDAFNKGINIATGDLIGIINSDDKLYPGALEILVSNYKEDIDVYYGQCVVFNDKTSKEYLVVPKKELNLLYTKMPIYHPSTFIKRSAYLEFEVFDTGLKYCMDRELLLRFLESGAIFLYIDKPLAYYREGGVNQVNYKKNLEEGTEVSIRYGMGKTKAVWIKKYEYVHYKIWRLIQRFGLEKMIHKQVSW